MLFSLLYALIHSNIRSNKLIKKTGIMIIDNDEEEEDEDDTKLILKVVGKGEVSLSVSAGIVVCDTKVFTLAILAGIKGLLGSGEIGLELLINISKGNIITDRFFVIKAFYVSLFLKLKIGIHTKFYDGELKKLKEKLNNYECQEGEECELLMKFKYDKDIFYFFKDSKKKFFINENNLDKEIIEQLKNKWKRI